jgi:DNA-binding PadR family transcriptional regulator
MNEMPRGYCNCGPFRVDIVPKGLLKPLVLKLLSERPMHGFELMEQIFEKTNGMWRPGPAAIYPTLEWLEANGYIKSDETEKRSEKTRRQYYITKKGTEALEDYEKSAQEIKKRMQEFSSVYGRI